MSKCLGCIKSCLGVLFPSLLEGLTHPDQRDELPSVKRKKEKLKYQRVSNPGQGEEDSDEDMDEESKVSTTNSTIVNNNQEEDPNQFFNEFSSWRSNQQQQQQQQQKKTSGTEMTDLKKGKATTLLTMSENDIDKQKNQIQDGTDDLFKGFEQPKPKSLQKPPAATSSRNQLNSLFNELASTTTQQPQPQLQLFNNDQEQAANGNLDQNLEAADSKQDIMEEKGWDEEININIE